MKVCKMQVWYEYGTFCLRTSKHGQAEQCLKEAAAIDSGHRAGLMALAALLWHTGLHTDSAHLDEAETVLHAAREAAPDDAAVWALLTLLYASMASRRVSEHRNAAFEMRRLAKLGNNRRLSGNPYLQVSLQSWPSPHSVKSQFAVCLRARNMVTFDVPTVMPCSRGRRVCWLSSVLSKFVQSCQHAAAVFSRYLSGQLL